MQAYPFSFGHYRELTFHTIMSYGNEPESAVFSNPRLTDLRGQACGVAAGDPESADNARGFTQTRFMVAGYESASLASELINDYRIIDEACELDEGGEGYRTGHAMQTNHPTRLIFEPYQC